MSLGGAAGGVRKRKKGPKVVLINIKNTQYPAIARCGKRLGWCATESTEKNLLFWYDVHVGVDFCLTLRPWQFVNHFPGTFAISRKVELGRNYERMQRLFPDFYNFHPLSFVLPTQLSDLQHYMRSASLRKRTFIVKPDLGAQGRGIFLVMDPDSMSGYRHSAIAQQYISPFLVRGLKFDFRIYVLLTSIDPLRVYIYDEGMARFCTEAYRKPRPHNLKEVFCHLTNYSVNKKNDNYERPTDSESGHKRSLTSVFGELSGLGCDVVGLQKKIDDLIVLTIIAAQPHISHNYKASVKADDGKSRCFEILGFDVLVDKRAKPWLLEVNSSPSLLCESPFDKELKDGLITGAMQIIDLDPGFKKRTIAYERERTVKRISGVSQSGEAGKLWDAARESELAGGTGWRLIHPSSERQEVYDFVEGTIGKHSIDGVSENAATQKRREAIQQAISEKEKLSELAPKVKAKKVKVVDDVPSPPIQIGRTPKSQLLLREAKLSKIVSDAKREQAARLQGEGQLAAQIGRKGSFSHLGKIPPLSTQQLVFGSDL